jgi:hypothetical protein
MHGAGSVVGSDEVLSEDWCAGSLVEINRSGKLAHRRTTTTCQEALRQSDITACGWSHQAAAGPRVCVYNTHAHIRTHAHGFTHTHTHTRARAHSHTHLMNALLPLSSQPPSVRVATVRMPAASLPLPGSWERRV